MLGSAQKGGNGQAKGRSHLVMFVAGEGPDEQGQRRSPSRRRRGGLGVVRARDANGILCYVLRRRAVVGPPYPPPGHRRMPTSLSNSASYSYS